MTRKWIEINDLSHGHYSAKKNIRFKTPRLRSDLRDYSDVYFVVKGIIDPAIAWNWDMIQKGVVFKIILHLG